MLSFNEPEVGIPVGSCVDGEMVGFLEGFVLGVRVGLELGDTVGLEELGYSVDGSAEGCPDG